jgi:tRNA (cytidine/uridine-2'-O-)-methyltransferase
MFEVVLYRPEIPPNTGNVIRLCANVGARLHLVEPLGFTLDDKQLRRAGLDYHEMTIVRVHPGWASVATALAGRRIFAASARGGSSYTDIAYAAGDAFVFGGETSGLPADFLATFREDRRIHIPMQPGNRSLNLSNSVAVVVFEAWRQQGFPGTA